MNEYFVGWGSLALINAALANVDGRYPDLEEDDIRQALRYASFLANEETYPATGTESR